MKTLQEYPALISLFFAPHPFKETMYDLFLKKGFIL